MASAFIGTAENWLFKHMQQPQLITKSIMHYLNGMILNNFNMFFYLDKINENEYIVKKEVISWN